MQRFFFSHLPLGKDITISEVSFMHQISRVLRSKVGENIVLFNGDGQDYVYSIGSIATKEIGLKFEKTGKNMCDPETIIRLYQAMPNKYEKIEYILQKGTEVWVREFVFFRSERSQKLVVNARKTERFQDIVREATEQCGGNSVPSVTFYEGNTLPLPEDGVSYLLHTEERWSKNLKEIDTRKSPVNLFVGPEGGWSSAEVSSLEMKNIQKIHLWDRVLRTETTWPVLAFSIIQK